MLSPTPSQYVVQQSDTVGRQIDEMGKVVTGSQQHLSNEWTFGVHLNSKKTNHV